MNIPMLLFFNGDNCHCPESNDWENFTGADEMKLALVCADRWKNYGWQVLRFVCSSDNSWWPEGTPLRESVYPYNNFLPYLADYMRVNHADVIAWTTTDVFPQFPAVSVMPDYAFPSHVWQLFQPGETGTFTLAMGIATLVGVRKLISALEKLNRIEYCLGMGRMVADEYLLRKHEETWRKTINLPTYYLGNIGFPGDNMKPLWHYSRSTLARRLPKAYQRF